MSKYALLPYRRTDMSSLLGNLEREFFGANNAMFTSAFNTDILDEGDHYLLEAELPGFLRNEIGIDVEGDQLVIRAAHEEEKEDKKKSYLHRERVTGTYVRRFDIAGIDVENISAKYEDGILRLTLPKQEKKAPAGKKIEIQ